MNVPVWVGKSELSIILWTKSLDLIVEMIESSVRQAGLAKMCRCIGMAKIERDRLYAQDMNPDTGEPFDSSTAYFANPNVILRFGIPEDRRKRSNLMIQGRALLEASTAGVIDIDSFDPTRHWEKLKSWSKAVKRHKDVGCVMKRLLDCSKVEFEAFASGKEMSSRLETSQHHDFQRYFLGYEGSFRARNE
jgi:hypothetical protein